MTFQVKIKERRFYKQAAAQQNVGCSVMLGEGKGFSLALNYTSEDTTRSEHKEKREVDTTVCTAALIFRLLTDVDQAVLFITVQRPCDKNTLSGMYTHHPE